MIEDSGLKLSTIREKKWPLLFRLSGLLLCPYTQFQNGVAKWETKRDGGKLEERERKGEGGGGGRRDSEPLLNIGDNNIAVLQVKLCVMLGGR